MEEQAKLPKPELDLPKPQTDLPLPEKELPSHSTPALQDETLEGYGGRFHFPKYIFLGIAFVILLSIIGGAYFLGRNSVFKELNPTAPTVPPPDEPKYDPTTDWQTYTGNGFSFKYPTDFEIHVNEAHIFETTDYEPVKNHIELNSPSATAIPFITINYTLNTSDLSRFIDSVSQCVDVNSKKGGEISIGNVSGKVFANTRCGVSETTEIHFVKNNVGYVVGFNGELDQNFLNQFLSAFKFSDTMSGTGISGKIILSPTCGGPQQAGENCTKPYKATVIVKNKNGKEITRFTSNDNGVFSVKLQAGIYILEPVNKTNDIYPVGKPQEVKVTDGKMTDVTIIYETGML